MQDNSTLTMIILTIKYEYNICQETKEHSSSSSPPPYPPNSALFGWISKNSINLPSGFARLHQLLSYQAEASHIPLHQPRQQFQNLQ